MATRKTKKHTFIFTIAMDKACSRKLALREVRSELKGQDFYTTQYLDSEPGQFWVRGIRLAKAEG